MDDIYTGFSDYEELNADERATAARRDVEAWENAREAYEEYRRMWHRADAENLLPSQPLHVDIELSDACNLKCRMCAHGIGIATPVGFMEEELVFRLIDECVSIGVCSVKFNWRGEAALNPLLPAAVARAKQRGILEVQINTNGLPKKKDIYLQCAEAGIDRIIFSVDGFSAPTYQAIRIGGDYQTLVANIQRLLEWKASRQRRKPLIRVQMVRTRLNAHEVDDFLEYWRSRVDDVRISDVMDRGQGDSLTVGDQKTVGRRRCPQPFQRLVVARDGRVSPCCADWDQQYIVGDVHEQSLLEIWNSEPMARMRDIQNRVALDTVKICSRCYVKESYHWAKR